MDLNVDKRGDSSRTDQSSDQQQSLPDNNAHRAQHNPQHNTITQLFPNHDYSRPNFPESNYPNRSNALYETILPNEALSQIHTNSLQIQQPGQISERPLNEKQRAFLQSLRGPAGYENKQFLGSLGPNIGAPPANVMPTGPLNPPPAAMIGATEDLRNPPTDEGAFLNSSSRSHEHATNALFAAAERFRSAHVHVSERGDPGTPTLIRRTSMPPPAPSSTRLKSIEPDVLASERYAERPLICPDSADKHSTTAEPPTQEQLRDVPSVAGTPAVSVTSTPAKPESEKEHTWDRRIMLPAQLTATNAAINHLSIIANEREGSNTGTRDVLTTRTAAQSEDKNLKTNVDFVDQINTNLDSSAQHPSIISEDRKIVSAANSHLQNSQEDDLEHSEVSTNQVRVVDDGDSRTETAGETAAKSDDTAKKKNKQKENITKDQRQAVMDYFPLIDAAYRKIFDETGVPMKTAAKLYANVNLPFELRKDNRWNTFERIFRCDEFKEEILRTVKGILGLHDLHEMSAKDCYDYLLKSNCEELEKFIKEAMGYLNEAGMELTVQKRKNLFERRVRELRYYLHSAANLEGIESVTIMGGANVLGDAGMVEIIETPAAEGIFEQRWKIPKNVVFSGLLTHIKDYVHRQAMVDIDKPLSGRKLAPRQDLDVLRSERKIVNPENPASLDDSTSNLRVDDGGTNAEASFEIVESSHMATKANEVKKPIKRELARRNKSTTTEPADEADKEVECRKHLLGLPDARRAWQTMPGGAARDSAVASYVKARLSLLLCKNRTHILCNPDILFKLSKFPWINVPSDMAADGVRARGWPCVLATLPITKGKGIQKMGYDNLLVLLDALEDENITVDVLEGDDLQDLQRGVAPVIITAAPHARSNKEKGYQVYYSASGPIYDQEGPERLPPATPPPRRHGSDTTLVSQKTPIPIVVMKSPSKSNMSAYKPSEIVSNTDMENCTNTSPNASARRTRSQSTSVAAKPPSDVKSAATHTKRPLDGPEEDEYLVTDDNSSLSSSRPRPRPKKLQPGSVTDRDPLDLHLPKRARLNPSLSTVLEERDLSASPVDSTSNTVDNAAEQHEAGRLRQIRHKSLSKESQEREDKQSKQSEPVGENRPVDASMRAEQQENPDDTQHNHSNVASSVLTISGTPRSTTMEISTPGVTGQSNVSTSAEHVADSRLVHNDTGQHPPHPAGMNSYHATQQPFAGGPYTQQTAYPIGNFQQVGDLQLRSGFGGTPNQQVIYVHSVPQNLYQPASILSRQHVGGDASGSRAVPMQDTSNTNMYYGSTLTAAGGYTHPPNPFGEANIRVVNMGQQQFASAPLQLAPMQNVLLQQDPRRRSQTSTTGGGNLVSMGPNSSDYAYYLDGFGWLTKEEYATLENLKKDSPPYPEQNQVSEANNNAGRFLPR